MNFLGFIYGILHPIGRNQRLISKNWDEQIKLYNKNTELTKEFGEESYSLDEHILNKSRIKELELEVKKIENNGGYYYNA